MNKIAFAKAPEAKNFSNHSTGKFEKNVRFEIFFEKKPFDLFLHYSLTCKSVQYIFGMSFKGFSLLILWLL